MQRLSAHLPLLSHAFWLSVLTLALTACGGGGGGGGNGGDTPPPEESALFSNPTYSSTWGTVGVFTDAAKCATCHTGDQDLDIMYHVNNDVSPAAQWKHSVMAHSLNDPFFTAMVEEESHVFPAFSGFIEDTCLRCHAPMAYTHAHQSPDLLLEEGYYRLDTAMMDSHAREGISCTACHQMQDPTTIDPLKTAEENLLDSVSGHYKIKSPEEYLKEDNLGLNSKGEPIIGVIFGPFLNPHGDAMPRSARYEPQYAAHISESAMCATCHNLYTPTIRLDKTLHTVDAAGDYDANSETVAQFPEQTPYWDWLNSKYSDPTTGKTCQACHMAPPADNYQTKITKQPENSPLRPEDNGTDKVFSVHEFVGGNSYLLGLLSKYMTELGIADKTTEAGFNEKIAQTQSLLKTAADLTIGAQSVVNSTLSIPVTITNLTGHKLPASFPSRRMWVHLKVTDAQGNTVFESGRHENGRIVGKDNAFTDSRCLATLKAEDFTTSLGEGCYEPHRDTIWSSDQVAIFESVLGDVEGQITHVLLHAYKYLKDNRLPPQGWTLENRHPNPVTPLMWDDDIIGAAVDDDDFAIGKADPNVGSDGKDTITYAVDINGFSAPFNVQAELLYQTIRPSFVAAMHADDEIEGDSHVGRFKEMYDQTPPTPEVIATYPATP